MATYRLPLSMVMTAVCAVGYSSAYADNRACWGFGADDRERQDISCTALTERLLLSLRGASRADVLRAMNAQGRIIPNDGLHFASNYERGAKGFGGDVNFYFENDRIINIVAEVDGPPGGPANIEFIWNARVIGCSDFPGSRRRCN